MKRYQVHTDNAFEDFESADDKTALEYAEDWLRDGEWPVRETAWPSASVWTVDEHGQQDECVGHARIRVDPEEPDCDDPRGHYYRHVSTTGHGGGVTIRDVCRRCGVIRVRDTWAQDRSTGDQGLTSVRYEEPSWLRGAVMTCPECDSVTRVLQTQPRESWIWRRRICKGCGHSFSTWEAEEGEALERPLTGE